MQAAPAPSLPPVSIESAFVAARVAAVRAEDPLSVLARKAPPAAKLAAIGALHGSIPTMPQARRSVALDALRVVAASPAEAAAVRGSALSALGYAIPVVGDAAARERAARTLIAALGTPDRVYALRGMGPAAHDLPEALEADFQGALLAALAGPLTVEERVTALLALDSFTRAREDLPRRKPALCLALEAALLAPVEAAPAAFAAARTPEERSMLLAVVWHDARVRASAGDPSVLSRVNALFALLTPLETDPDLRAELGAYLAAPARKP